MPDLGQRPGEPDARLVQQKQLRSYIKETELLFHERPLALLCAPSV